MNKISTLPAMIMALALPLMTPSVQAATANVTARVTRTLVTADNTYGGCMALLSVSVQAALPNCPVGSYVTFDCAGQFVGTNVVRAYRMFDQAQLALATGKNVLVTVTDDKKANTYCFATRIDVY